MINPGSTRTGWPSPRGQVAANAGIDAMKAANSGKARNSIRRSRFPGGAVATSMSVLQSPVIDRIGDGRPYPNVSVNGSLDSQNRVGEGKMTVIFATRPDLYALVAVLALGLRFAEADFFAGVFFFATVFLLADALEAFDLFFGAAGSSAGKAAAPSSSKL